MSDTQEAERTALFLRFFSVIQQVISDKILECELDFRHFATLNHWLVLIIMVLGSIWAEFMTGNLTVLDLTVTDAIIDLCMASLQKGIRDC